MDTKSQVTKYSPKKYKDLLIQTYIKNHVKYALALTQCVSLLLKPKFLKYLNISINGILKVSIHQLDRMQNIYSIFTTSSAYSNSYKTLTVL